MDKSYSAYLVCKFNFKTNAFFKNKKFQHRRLVLTGVVLKH